MKKSSIKKTCLAIIIVAAILILTALLRLRPAPVSMPAFKFLSGRALTVQIEENQSAVSQTQFIYSFEADYETFLADANSELLTLGYQKIPPPPQSYFLEYILSGRKPVNVISVTFVKNHKMNVYSTPKNSEYKTPTLYEYSWKDGWVSVKIEMSKNQNRFIAKIKQLFQKLRGAEQ